MGEKASDWDPLYGQVEGMYVWRDMLCLPCMPKDIMDEMVDNFVFRPDDVLLASYPQSSFFWVQEVIWHLHNLDTLGVPLTEKPPLAKRLPFLEHEFKLMDPRTLHNLPSPRLLKTHLSHRYWAENMEPVKHQVKVIQWAEEPKDIVANYCDYWNIKGEYFNFPKIQWDHFFDLFKRDRLFEGNWYEMNLSWQKAYENSPNLLLLSYEKSRRNPSGCVRKIADFLGITVTDEQVGQIVGMKEFDKWPEWSRMFNSVQKEYTNELTKSKVAGTPLADLYPCDNGIL